MSPVESVQGWDSGDGWSRVVSLDNLEPGDELERTIRGIENRFVCIDVSKNGLVVFIKNGDGTVKALSKKDLTDWCYKPVQPAPAEKEEEWWDDDSFRRMETDVVRPGQIVNLVPDFPKIVAEAKRRGAEEAWKEVRSLADDCDEFGDLSDAIDRSLERFSKPAGAGEK